MKSSMLVDFKILKRNEDGEFVPMNKCLAEAVSIGGFCFDINGQSIPFDWDAFTGAEENGVFRFYTGKGFLFNDYELSSNYDKTYQDMGIKRDDISAEFLASVHHIEEFFVDFQSVEPFEDDYTDVGIGYFSDNAKKDLDYKLELVGISFKDMETEKIYDVKKEVLEAFNKGEFREYDKILSLYSVEIFNEEADVLAVISNKSSETLCLSFNDRNIEIEPKGTYHLLNAEENCEISHCLELGEFTVKKLSALDENIDKAKGVADSGVSRDSADKGEIDRDGR